LFYIVELKDVIRVPPSKFGTPLKDVAYETLKAKYESSISPEYGYLIYIINLDVEKVGKIIPGDGATYHHVTFKALTFLPKIQEIMEGEVVEVADFGAFVRLGPADALLHLSQITDDYLTCDVKQGVITAAQSKRVLSVGSKVRVRVTAVSLGHGATAGKIGVTCRQPFLGALEWIEEDLRKVEAKPEAKKAEKKEKIKDG
jgi:DNA-directed RNA polymerase subunit E'